MPPALLESQLATLEPLEADEAGVVVDIAGPVAQVMVDALAGIAAAVKADRRRKLRCSERLGTAPSGAAGTQGRQFDVDLKAAPFNLDDAAVDWVNSTLESMTLEEKIGQLFINHNNDYSPEYLDGVLENYHVGGMRYRPGPSAAVQEHIRYAQSKTKVPLLIASNPEMGGAGSCDDGTFVSTHLQAGSHPDKSIARQMGQVAGVETAALGCNWAFAPIVDIHYNWRNTVISTRSFGNTPEVVVERAKEYFDGISESPTVCAMKHFPGDGMDERDQHVVTSYNTFGYDEWNKTYGHVYREMIGHGVQSIMIGHIGAPELSRHFRPGLADADIKPATLAPGTAAGPAARRARLQRADPHGRLADDRPDPGHEAQGPGACHHCRRLRHVPVLPQRRPRTSRTCWTATSPASSPSSACMTPCAASWRSRHRWACT